MKTNLVMPMGGAGTRFLNNGFECPKPLIKLKDRPFFRWACDSVYDHMETESLTFVVLKEHIERFGIDREIRSFYPDAGICVLDSVLNGAVLTAMEGARSINNDDPVIFCDCDLLFRCGEMYDYYDNLDEKDDTAGTLLTFESDEDRYSYVRLDKYGAALETAEKKVISRNAITGAYGFRNKDIFLDAAGRYMSECIYKEYFMSGIYNLLIGEGCHIRAFRCDSMLSFGTPEEYEKAEAADIKLF